MKSLFITLGALLLGLTATSSSAETREDIRVEHARVVYDDFLQLPEQGIPVRLIQRATAIAVVPSVVKVGAVVGARYGRGILITRTPDGRWLPPTFISVSGGSIGWQVGAQATDLILVFTDNDALKRIRSAGLTLGADAAIAAGPLGRTGAAATDIRFDAPVFSYSRTQGLFAGVALDGTVIKPDYKANARFYRTPGITIDSVATANRIPASAEKLLATLNGTPGFIPNPTAASSEQTTSEENTVVTYGLGDAPVERD